MPLVVHGKRKAKADTSLVETPAKPAAPTAGRGLRRIDGKPFRAIAALAAGARPRMDDIEISALRIDDRFQRELGREGEAHVRRIARAFDWRKFTPVIVAPIGGDLYSVIDGQHRATAAAACGFERVPAAIYDCDPKAAADAFQAINSATRRLTSMQIFWAKVAADDAAAVTAAEICREAGVTLLRYPVAAGNLKSGETICAATILKLLGIHGREALSLALKCLAAHDSGGLLLSGRWILALTRALAKMPGRNVAPQFARLDHHRLEGEAERAALADGGPVTQHLQALLAEKLA